MPSLLALAPDGREVYRHDGTSMRDLGELDAAVAALRG